MKDNKTFHILSIINDLSQDKTVCLKELAFSLDISIRTAQRYIVDIAEFFGKENILLQNRGCYKAKSPALFEKVLIRPEKGFMSDIFVDFFADKLLNERLSPKNKGYIKRELEKNKKIYNLKNDPFTRISFGLLNELKEAIIHKKMVNISLQSRFQNFDYIKPVRIIFEDCEFYLAFLTQDFGVTKNVRYVKIAQISSVELLDEEFTLPSVVVENIQKLSVNRLLLSEDFRVKIEVAPPLIGHFKSDKPLRNQTVSGLNQKGWLEIEFDSNNPAEVYMLAKKYIPHVKILSPQSLKDSFFKQMKDFINSMEDDDGKL